MANDDDNTVEDYFQYKPSLALNIVALTLFLGITIIISVQNVRYKAKFMWIVTFTGCLEVAGYVCHMVGTETVNSDAYIAYLVFTILAPNFLALANYIAVGKIAQHLALSGRFLNTKTIAVGFFVVDLICIGIQGGGSAVVSGDLQDDGSASRSGENVILVGLAIQLFFFASFTFVAFHVWRLQQKLNTHSISPRAFVCLFTTTALITLRNTYRVIEIADGWDGKYNTREKYFYCLDALPIFLAFVVYSLLHLGKFLNVPLLPIRSDNAAVQQPVSGNVSMVNTNLGKVLEKS